jgi:choline kinase
VSPAPYQAVILAAGRGSRLAERTGEMPKALLPIGPRTLDDPTETNFLRRQAELLREVGVEQVVVVVGYLREQVYAALEGWGDWVQTVVNPATDITTSGSLDSFHLAARSDLGVLDGSKQTLMLDADIVYHPAVLRLLIEAPEQTSMLVCSRSVDDNEEVLVYGSPEAPRFQAKGLSPDLVGGAACIGEAVGIVKYAPADHALAREGMRWMLGDPDAPRGDPRRKGFGPARRATEHEELSQRLMQLGRMRCVVFGEELPFMEVDSAEEYAELRQTFYPNLLRLEAGAQ